MADIDMIPVINSLEAQYLEGDAEALLTALSLCTCLEDSPMPYWVADAVNQALTNYQKFEIKTLDEAFGITRKGVQMEKKRRKPDEENAVAGEAFRLKRHGTPISDELFEIIGEKLNMSASKVSRLYYKKD
jgi:hypothetical protein